MKYGQILQELDDLLIKRAFIPSPTSSAARGGSEQGGPGGPPPGAGGPPPGAGGPAGGQEQQAQMAQMAQQSQQGQGQGQDPSQGQQGQDPSQGQAPPGGDLTPSNMAPGLKNTPVTVSVAELLDLVSGGKASQAHLKTESMKVQHGFKHKKMMRDEQRKEQEEEQQRQQEQMQQQQQGMMGGGIYSGGAMDGSQPGQSGPPAQPGQPQ